MASSKLENSSGFSHGLLTSGGEEVADVDVCDLLDCSRCEGGGGGGGGTAADELSDFGLLLSNIFCRLAAADDVRVADSRIISSGVSIKSSFSLSSSPPDNSLSSSSSRSSKTEA